MNVLPLLLVVELEILVVALAISGVVTLWLRVIKILREFQVTEKARVIFH